MPKVTKQHVRRTPVTKAGNVVDRIKPIGFNPEDPIKINLYGQSGTGKTTLWATFPKPILAIICSGASRPGETRSIDTKEYRKTISQVVLNESNELQGLVDYQKSEGKYATVVLDHASGLQDLILREVVGLAEIPVQKSWGMASREQYGQIANQMKERFRSLLDLSCNIVIVAQEREFEVESVTDLIMPHVAGALMPSVAGWLHPAVDYICQTFLRAKTETKEVNVGNKKVKTKERVEGQVEYCLRTAPHDVFTTKFRVPKGTPLPEVIVNADFDKIMELIQGEQ